jgi:alanyl-tRNA synthetase
VFEDRPVTARFVSPDELARLPLRKPPKVEENIRIVHVDGFDWSACGGTHVSSAGQIGLIKIVRLERRGAETRVEFCCGQRALADYRRKNAMLGQVTADLSIGYWELDAAIARLQAEAKDTHKKLADAEKKLMLYEADELAAQARDMGAFAVIGHVWDGRDANALRLVAHKLIARPRTVVLLGSSGVKRSALLFARSADVDADMAAWLRQAAERLGGKGGGGPDMAQGGGGPADASQVQAALEWVVEAMVKT